MSDHACDLCGLDLGNFPLPLDHAGNELRFCCEGCLGIYCMLHGVEAAANQAQSHFSKTTDEGA